MLPQRFSSQYNTKKIIKWKNIIIHDDFYVLRCGWKNQISPLITVFNTILLIPWYRYFEKSGCSITANGSDDAKINWEMKLGHQRSNVFCQI